MHDGDQTRASGIAYHPSGAVAGFTFGNQQHEQTTFDGRYRPWHLTSGPLDLTYSYYDSGNVQSISDPRPDHSYTYYYDELDRLTTVMNGTTLVRNYGYDALGNRLSDGLLNYSYDGFLRLAQTTGQGGETFGYDNVGNLTSEGTSTFSYNAFNMLKTATVNTFQAAYGYDGDNLRAWKTDAAGEHYFVRGIGGQLLAEYDDAGGQAALTREYIYLGGRLLASVGNPSVPPPAVTVAVTAPQSGDKFAEGDDITFTASPYVAGGSVDRVEFYLNGVLLDQSSNAPYTVTHNELLQNSYGLVARVIATTGDVSSSAVTPFTVFRPGRVTSVDVSPAAVDPGAPATITAHGNDVQCDAVQFDFGDGTGFTWPWGQDLQNHPLSIAHAWSTGGTKTITLSGHGQCRGVQSVEFSVNGPAVSITAPTNQSRIFGPSTIAVQASATTASGSIAHVDFYAGSSLLGTTAVTPYSISWPSVPAGHYVLTARATDTAGVTSISKPVVIDVGNLSNVTITPSPVQLGEAATITVNGLSICSAIQVNTGDGPPITYPISGLPLMLPHVWRSLGTKTVSATAAGNCAGTANGVVTVVANAPPSVALTVPPDGAYVPAGSTVSLSATASDADGISKVEFYNGSTLLGAVSAAPYAWTLTNLQPGAYAFTAKAYDTLNGSASSTIVHLTVTNLAAVTAAPAVLAVGQSSTITVTAVSCSAAQIDFGDGTVTSYTPSTWPLNATHAWATTGTKTVIATGLNGCTGVLPATVNVGAYTPPSVTLTAPMTGTTATYGSPVTLTATATDPNGITKVEFYNGSTLLGTDTTAPYSFDWINPPRGSYAITAKAYDAFGLTTTTSVATLDIRDVTGVSVSPSSPGVGTSARVTVTGWASCNAVTVDFGDGNVITFAISSLPIDIYHTWTSAGVKSVRATGQSLCQDSPTPTSVTVLGPPSVSITSPGPGAAFGTPATVGLTVSATAAQGSITQVAYQANGVTIGTVTAAPFSFTWSGMTPGTYALTATATDSSGLSATSGAVNITVYTSSGAAATFTGLDTTTQGNWMTAYGADGYGIAGDVSKNPSYGTWSQAGSLYVWDNNASDGRALQRAGGAGRVAGTWYGSSYTYDLNFTDGQPHEAALYALSYDWIARTERFDVTETSSGTLLDSRTVSGFTGGTYVVWSITGHVTIRVTLVSGDPNAVVSGIFFGGGVPGSRVVGVGIVSTPVVAGVQNGLAIVGTNPCGAITLDFGDGNWFTWPIDSLPVPYFPHTWWAPGTYTVTITGQGNCSGTATTTVAVTGIEPTPTSESPLPIVPGATIDSAQLLTSGEVPWEDSGHVHPVGSASDRINPDASSLGSLILPLYSDVLTIMPTGATVTVDLNGTGSGSVSGTIYCAGHGISCSSTLTAGGQATFNVIPDATMVFTGWTGACSGMTASCTVAVADHQLVIANFRATPPMITSYYHTDATGSVRASTAPDGAVVERHDYYPFGVDQTTTPVQDGGDSRRFGGAERDSNGLDYLEHRYYNPSLGIFTTSDPDHIGGNLADPQSWNAYSFARNNPERFSDPSGTTFDFTLNLRGGGYASVQGMSDQDFFSMIRNTAGFFFDPLNGSDSESGNIYYMSPGGAITIVGHYFHYNGDLRTFAAGVARAGAGVSASVKILSFWASVAVPEVVAAVQAISCLTSSADCRGAALAMALTPRAARLLGALVGKAGMTIEQVIKLQGGGGRQMNEVATYLRGQTLGNVAERAVQGDREAEKAVKIAKDAKRLAEKGGGD